MRNSKFKKFSILGLLPVALTVGVVSLHKNAPTEVDAYTAYTEGSLPTTIDLNDASETTIRNYYSELDGKGLNGTDLLKALKPILSNGQKYFSYDSTSAKNAIWRAYEIVDRDWTLSPASQIAGYDSNTNKITGYTYKASTEFSSSKNPYLHALYVDRNMDNPIKAWGNHNQTEGGINQEHIWPKSHGFDTENAGGARGDLMHLWAADGYTNKVHSNYSYGNVDKTKSYDAIVDTIYYSTGNYLGTSKRLGTGTVFEPQDCDKGDIARALFYMAARYNNYAGAVDGIDSNDPYLVLRDVTSPAMQKGSTCTATEPGEYGILSDLLEWNRLDPVDQFEIHRNNILFNSYTKNRNPFIDYPEWAELIWGNNKTGTASPATDEINGGESGQESEEETGTFIKATSISVGDKIVIASESAGMELTGISSTTTPYGIGSKYNTNLKGSYIFDVVAGSSASTYAFKTGTQYLNWSSGNSLSLSNTINANSSWTVSFDGSNNVLLSPSVDTTRTLIWNNISTGLRFACYTDYTNKISGSYKTIQVYKKDMSTPVTGVELDASSVTIEVGQTIQLTPTVNPSKASNKDVTWTSSDSAVASVENGKIIGIKAGSASITVKTVDGNFTAACSITVKNPPQVVSIDVSGDYKKTYEVGAEYTEDGFVVTAHLDNDEYIDVTNKSEISSIDTSTAGVKTITIKYGNFIKTINVQVYNADFVFDSTAGYENAEVIESVTKNGITLKMNKVGTSPKYYTSGTALRIYNNNSFTFTCNDKIVGITFAFGPSDGNAVFTPSVGTFDGAVWEGKSNEVTFTVGSEGTQRRIQHFYVTTVPNPHVDSITATGLVKTVYEIGDAFDPSGLVVKALFDDNTNVILNDTEYTITGFDSSTSGNKTLTISYEDTYGTTKTVSVDYKVSEATLSSIAISGNYKTSYKYGEELDITGLVVTATYSDTSTDNVTSLANITGYDSTTLGDQTITVSYTEGEISKTLTYKVNVQDYLESIAISGDKKIEYKFGDEFSKENIVVTATMASGAKKNVTNNATFTGYNSEQLGPQEVTVSYTEGEITKTSKYNIVVYDFLKGLTLGGTYKTSYKWGESFSSDGMVVKANMASGDVVIDNPSFSTFDSTTPGEQTIKVSYTYDGVTKDASYKVNVAEPKLTEITVNPNGQTTFAYNEEFKHNLVVVTAKYEDNSTKIVEGTFSGYSKTTKGNQTITVSYTDAGVTKTATYVVSVDPAKLTSITVDPKNQTTFAYNEAFKSNLVEVTAHYEDGSSKAVTGTFTGYNPTIVGQQTITVSYTDNGVTKTATYTVTVNNPLLTSITVANAKTDFDYGQSFSTGSAIVTAHYEDGSSKAVTGTFTGYNPTKLGEQTITVSYTEAGVTKTTQYTVEVMNFAVGIVASGDYKTEYTYGEAFSHTGMKVDLVMVDGSTQTVNKTIVDFTGYNKKQLGNQTITVSYNGFTDTYVVNVKDDVKTIAVTGTYKAIYVVGDELKTDGMVIKATMLSGATSTIDLSKVTFSGFDSSTAGTKTVTVTYNGITTTVDLIVNESAPTLSLAGCFGSITGTLGIISLVSALGAGLLLFKKKED